MEKEYQHYENKTKDEVLKLIKEFGSKDNMLENQNDSPSVEEFLQLADDYPAIVYHGYIIKKPRTDFRVAIEGFIISSLTAEQALDIMHEYAYADECDYQKEKNGTFTIRTWWD